MIAPQIESFHREITTLIDEKELKNAISRLHSWLITSPDWEAEEQLKQWETTYKYMLLYFSQGNPDPEREKVYHNLISHLYSLVDSIADALLLKESPSYFFDRKRYLNYSSQISVTQIQNRIEKGMSDLAMVALLDDESQKDQQQNLLSHTVDNNISELFLHVWLANRWTEDDKEIHRLILASSLPVDGICLTVSAITLSLLRSFDEAKCIWLIDACFSNEESIRQRALVGILLVFNRYETRLDCYPEVIYRFAALSEKQGFANDCRNIILHFIRSRETEKISRRLTDEILPEMMKISPILRKKMNLEDWQQEANDEDKNPDWEEIFEQSGLNDKLKELSQLQMEGSDVFMTTFSGLKSFPFFYNISNWFLPFNLDHSAFLDRYPAQKSDKSIFSSIMKSGVLCNSDKYSLCFSLQQMPEEQRHLLVEQFSGEEQAQVEAEEALLLNNKVGDTIAKQYIQDLYRFFKLHPHRSDFTDVFALPMNFYRLSLLKPLLSDKESLRIIAEFLFRKEFYADAVEVFKELSLANAENSELLQKIGYCYQMMGDDQAALLAYLKSDMIYPDSAWTIRRVAQCYRRLKQPELALEYYRRYDKLKPDNLSVILNIGHCYLEQKNYTEALRFYFKADYLDNNNPKAWRPIAWCSFLAGKFEQAERYYQKVIQGKPLAQDYMNYGHVVWAQKDTHRALEFYLQSMRMNGLSWIRFKEAFKDDFFDLKMAGLTENELKMMLDELQYRIEE
ncbi:MAG: CDC27 family protein [Bacteroidales bacterium]|nr:CDC27 family protein [Bacteroidales bacterium]